MKQYFTDMGLAFFHIFSLSDQESSTKCKGVFSDLMEIN